MIYNSRFPNQEEKRAQSRFAQVIVNTECAAHLFIVNRGLSVVAYLQFSATARMSDIKSCCNKITHSSNCNDTVSFAAI